MEENIDLANLDKICGKFLEFLEKSTVIAAIFYFANTANSVFLKAVADAGAIALIYRVVFYVPSNLILPGINAQKSDKFLRVNKNIMKPFIFLLAAFLCVLFVLMIVSLMATLKG